MSNCGPRDFAWGGWKRQTDRQTGDASEDERGDSNVFFQLRYEILKFLLIGDRIDLQGFVQEVTKCMEQGVLLGKLVGPRPEKECPPTHPIHWNPTFYYCDPSSPLFLSVLPRCRSAQSTPPPNSFPKIHFNIFLPSSLSSSKWLLSFRFSNQNTVCTGWCQSHYPSGALSAFITRCWEVLSPTYFPVYFDDENIPFDASLVIYSIDISPIMIINRIYETQNLLSL